MFKQFVKKGTDLFARNTGANKSVPFDVGRREWIRTTDPHHVKVVL
jgi:hypothetical protein